MKPSGKRSTYLYSRNQTNMELGKGICPPRLFDAQAEAGVQAQASGIFIRKARTEDGAGILACLREAFEELREQYTPESFLDTVLTAETLQERLEKMSV